MSLGDKLFGKRKKLNTGHINALMKPTRNLMHEQLGISRQMMDPNSAINMRMRNLMAQRSAESGAQASRQMQAQGAQQGMSSAQAMMHARMASNEAMGGVNQQWQQGLQSQFGQGLGLMGNMTNIQKDLNESQVNAYTAQINAANARRSQNMGMGMSLVGGLMSGIGGGGKT